MEAPEKAKGTESIRGPCNPDLAPVAIAFAEAEQRLEQSEFFTGQVCVASINELRYAGCHLLRATCPDTPQLDELKEAQHHYADPVDGADREIARAIDHCKRAKYDAIAFDAHGAIRWLDLFKEDYRLILGEDILGLPDALLAANDAEAIIVFGKANANRRAEHLNTLDQLCLNLQNAERFLEALRCKLNAKRNAKQAELEERQRAQEDKKRQDRTTRFRWIVGLIVTAITSAAAIGIVKLYVDAKATQTAKPDATLNAPPPSHP